MSEDQAATRGATTAVAAPELVHESAGPAGVARSWAELIACLHGGIALLDDAARIVAVSAGFGEAVGLEPRSIVGRLAAEIFPNIANSGVWSVVERIARGHVDGIGQRVVDSDDCVRWVRLTGVPTAELDIGYVAILFVQDTTATSQAMKERRQATLRLTDVEEQELERLRRQLHDGPVQLLTALSWRLSTVADSPTVESIRETVADVTAELRHVLGEFAPDDSLAAGERLERWIGPYLADAPLHLTIEDHLTKPLTDELTQAAFVFLYELVRATRDLGVEREQRVSIDSERGGCRLVLTTTTHGSALGGAVASQYQAMVEYARSLGGSMQTEGAGENVRTFSVWLPKSASSPHGLHDDDDVAPRRETALHAAEWVRVAERWLPNELDDARWVSLIGRAPEPVVEYDAEFHLLYANPSYEQLEAASTAEIVARGSPSARFRPEEMAQIQPYMARLILGESVHFDALRRNASGDRRYVRLSAMPRKGEYGQVIGFVVASEDLSDLYFLEGLQSSALADLAHSRAQARNESFARLRAPMVGLQSIVAQAQSLDPSVGDQDAIEAICIGIEDAIRRVSRSIDLLAVPDLSNGDLGGAIRASLASLLGDVVLDCESNLPDDEHVDADVAEALFRIGREAVGNAVIHGRAHRIEMRLEADRGGVAMTIHNDGVPVDPATLDTTRDHLGVRLMVERAHYAFWYVHDRPR